MANQDGFGGQIEAAMNQLNMVGKAIVRAMPEAVAAGAEILQIEAALQAPWRTGRLAVSYGNEAVDEGDPNSAAHRVYFTAFHARFQEFGTGHHAAQPFLRPAAELKRNEIEGALADVIREAAGDAILQYRGVIT
jgi:HK97 gp10 family phage protein